MKSARLFLLLLVSLVGALQSGCASIDCDIRGSFKDELIPFEPTADGIIRSPEGSGIPDVEEALAPWDLTGDAYALLYATTPGFVEESNTTPATLEGRYTGEVSVLLIVDYKDTNVGPYGEIMYIPGTYRFRDKKCHSITKIYVTTWDSVVNGRENWGIPKDRADMDFHKNWDGTEEFSAYKDGKRIVHVKMRNLPLAQVPFAEYITPFAPKTITTLAQHYNGKTFFYTPEFASDVSAAALIDADFDPDYFPDLTQNHLLAAVKLSDVKMKFPEAKIIGDQL